MQSLSEFSRVRSMADLRLTLRHGDPTHRYLRGIPAWRRGLLDGLRHGDLAHKCSRGIQAWRDRHQSHVAPARDIHRANDYALHLPGRASADLTGKTSEGQAATGQTTTCQAASCQPTTLQRRTRKRATNPVFRRLAALPIIFTYRTGILLVLKLKCLRCLVADL